MSSLVQQMRTKFAVMSARERRLVLAAVAVVGLALIATAVEWVLRERARLDQELPRARAQLLQMQDDAAELAQLDRERGALPQVDPAALALSVETAARVRGLTVDVQPVAGGVQVSGSGSFPAVMEWLAGVQAESRLRPNRMTLAKEDRSVRFDAVLLP